MKKILHWFGAGLLGAIAAAALGATYTQFSPGGALSGSWNSQNINVGAGAPFVTGTLPAGNGGSGNTFFQVAGPATSVKTYTFPNASTTVLTTNAAVTVAQGGTGATSLTGPLKGNGTSAFTPALSADIIGLWSGTCNASSLLRGDGACAGETGTVSSVALTMPTGFSVGGSPVTSTGTLAVTTALSGVVKADGTGFSASNVSLTTEVTGTLPVANGGTGQTALSALTANPSASIGLAAVNGSASTFMRSDAAPALSQAISPTWSGSHTFSSSIAANGGIVATAATVGGQSVCLEDGTDCPAGVGETSGSFTATFADACTVSPTQTLDWVKIGNMVVLMVVAQSGFSCTSDSTSTVSGATDVPAGVRPSAASVSFRAPGRFVDNGAGTDGCMTLNTTGQLAYGIWNTTTGCATSGWTASGSKNATNVGFTVTYFVSNP